MHYYIGNFVPTWEWNQNCTLSYVFLQSNKRSSSFNMNSMMTTIKVFINTTPTLIITSKVLVSCIHMKYRKFTTSIHSTISLMHRDHGLFLMSSCAMALCCRSLYLLLNDSSQKPVQGERAQFRCVGWLISYDMPIFVHFVC